MRHVSKRWVVAAVILAAACGVLVMAIPTGSHDPGHTQTVSDNVSASNNWFTFDLYDELSESRETEDTKGNLFVSPYSVSSALAMAFAGARGETQRQMAQTLHWGLEDEGLHRQLETLRCQLDDGGKPYQLRVANALWGQTGEPFLNDYLACVQDRYGGKVARLDFAQDPEQARETINTWVEDQTAEKIKEIIPPGGITPVTPLVLVNAIYFKGKWARPFSPGLTVERPFKVTSWQKVPVPMMHAESRFKYYEDRSVQVLELPYEGEEIAMVVLLPREVGGIAGLEKWLTAERLESIVKRFGKEDIEVLLPRFTLIFKVDLSAVLKQMGIKEAFDQQKADFSGINGNKRDLFLSKAFHKAFVEVNEEGIEAAAATGLGLTQGFAPKHPIFHADHPFLFVIRHVPSRTILFMGRVSNPAAATSPN